MPDIKEAMVFAAGLGLRMRPLTLEIPKPLIKVKGKAMIDYFLDDLAKAGVETAVVNTHYKPEMIEDHLKDRKSPQVEFSYEETLLETGGGVALVLDRFSGPFLSVNTDTILPDGANVINQMKKAWRDEMDMLLLLQPLGKAFGFHGKGDFDIADNGELIKIPGREKYPYVFAGMQIINPRIFKRPHPEGPFSLNHFWKPGPDGKIKGIYGFINPGQWLHIGDPETLKEAEKIL